MDIKPEIVHGNDYLYENFLLKIVQKSCQITLHREMLMRYKKSKTFPKDLTLRFNLSLCKKDRNLQQTALFYFEQQPLEFKIRH